jgi:phosphoribosylformimino-5-aminoimidazole carboxamide ribotide isomerase
LVQQLVERCGADPVAVGLDARAGKVRLRGWSEDSAREALELAQIYAALGLRTVVFTDIARDGMGRGINVAASQKLAQSSGLEVIASGGARGLEDVRQVQQAGLAGVILGRALYEGSLNLEEALILET